MGVDEPLVAYAFDKWVNTYGRRVDSFLSERKEVKDGKRIRYEPKYSLETALAKAANDKRTKWSGFREMLDALDTPGAVIDM